jgi:hypothetical protein
VRDSTSVWRTLARPWSSWAGLAALCLVLGQGVWRGVLLARGFFTQDDYLMLRLGDEPLTLGLLTQDYSGHFFPGGFLFAWAHAHHAPLDWSVVVVETLTMQAVAAVLLWIVLCRLLPGSWARVPLLAVGLLCPLSLWPTQWWAVSIQFLPISICLLTATWAMLVHLQEGRRWAVPLVLAATALGMLFQERAVLFPVVLGLVACAYSPARGPRAIVEALRSRLVLWVPLGVLLAGYVVLHRSLAPIATTSAGSTNDGAELVGNFVARNAVPGFVGGSWNPEVFGDSLLVPPVYAVVTAWVVLGAAVVWSLRRTRAAAWGWLLLAVYMLVDVALLFAGRTAMGPTFGLIPRYAADIVPVLPLALALVVRAVLTAPAPDAGEAEEAGDVEGAAAPASRKAALVACGLALVYAASAAVTTHEVAHHSYNRADREFIETLRAELRAQPEVVLFDGGAPDELMIGWFGTDASVSTLAGIAPESPVFDLPSYSMRIVDHTGRLRPIDLVGTSASRPADDEVCGYGVTEAGTRIALEEPIDGERLVVRINYYTSATGSLAVTAGDQELLVPLRGDLNAVDLVVSGPVSSLEMALRPDEAQVEPGTVCVGSVVVGFPVARVSGEQ